MAEKARPGVMIYFEDYEPVSEVFDNEKLGEFFRAVMNYAKTGEWISDDADPTLRAFLRIFKPKIDRDGERYADVIAQRQYAVYCREVKKTDSEPVPYVEWKQHRLLSVDNESYPTATATATTTAIATPIAYSTATPPTTGKAIEKGCGEKERETPNFELDFENRKRLFMAQVKNFS